MNKAIERISKYLFLLTALIAVGAVLLICVFIFAGAFPALKEIGVIKFLTTTLWKPTDTPASFGIFYMIIGSLYVTAGAMIIGVPIGVLAAIFMARYCPKRIYPFVSQLIKLMAGIPSIIYGFFGMMIIVPFISETFGGNGNSVLAASLVLSMMILPTVITISEDSLRAVPEIYYEGALALGARKEEAVFKVVVPAAKNGIVTSVILATGRAIGETIAVAMVAGNSNILPINILKPVRTLTVNIIQEMSYASGLHYDALIATGAVLFVFILILNILLNVLVRRKVK